MILRLCCFKNDILAAFYFASGCVDDFPIKIEYPSCFVSYLITSINAVAKKTSIM